MRDHDVVHRVLGGDVAVRVGFLEEPELFVGDHCVAFGEFEVELDKGLDGLSKNGGGEKHLTFLISSSRLMTSFVFP